MLIRGSPRTRAFTLGLHHLSRCTACIFDIQPSPDLPVLRIKKACLHWSQGIAFCSHPDLHVQGAGGGQIWGQSDSKGLWLLSCASLRGGWMSDSLTEETKVMNKPSLLG